MDRRDFLVSMLQAFFLALFPWLRTERGADVLRAAIEQAVPEEGPLMTDRVVFRGGDVRLSIALRGFEVKDVLAGHPEWGTLLSEGQDA